jgi:hypothetical protein
VGRNLLIHEVNYSFRKERLGEETNGFLSQEKKSVTFSTQKGEDFQGGENEGGETQYVFPFPSLNRL